MAAAALLCCVACKLHTARAPASSTWHFVTRVKLASPRLRRSQCRSDIADSHGSHAHNRPRLMRRADGRIVLLAVATAVATAAGITGAWLVDGGPRQGLQLRSHLQLGLLHVWPTPQEPRMRLRLRLLLRRWLQATGARRGRCCPRVECKIAVAGAALDTASPARWLRSPSLRCTRRCNGSFGQMCSPST